MNLPPTEPNQGEPLRADWGRAIQRHARSCQIIGVTGGTFTRTDAGTVINIDRARAGGGAHANGTAEPFDIAVTKKYVDGEYTADTVSVVPGVVSVATANGSVTDGWDGSAFSRVEREYVFDKLTYSTTTGTTVDVPKIRANDVFVWAQVQYPAAYSGTKSLHITEDADVPPNLPWGINLGFPKATSPTTSIGGATMPSPGDGKDPNSTAGSGTTSKGVLATGAPNEGRAYTDAELAHPGSTYTGRSATTVEDMGYYKFTHVWRQYSYAGGTKFFYVLYQTSLGKSTKTHPPVPGTSGPGILWDVYVDNTLDIRGYTHSWDYRNIPGYGYDYARNERIASRLYLTHDLNGNVTLPGDPTLIHPSQPFSKASYAICKSYWRKGVNPPTLSQDPTVIWTRPGTDGIAKWRRNEGALIDDYTGWENFGNDPAFANGGDPSSADVGPDGNTSKPASSSTVPTPETSAGSWVFRIARITPAGAVEQYITGNQVVHPAAQMTFSALA